MLDNPNRSASLAINEKIRLFVYIGAVILLLSALLHNHYQLISSTIPIDYNEAAMPTITATIAAGENPYSIDNQPARASLYPPLYNIIVAPISLIVGNSLELHRIVVAIFIGLSVLLCFAATLRASGSRSNSLAAAALYYAALLFYSTPIASPNSLGLFFFLACLLIPWRYNFSNTSLAAALLFGVLSFYGKQYFVACIGYLALYLFIAVSKKKAVIFGVCSLLGLIFSLIAVHASSPYFLDNTVFSISTAVGSISSTKTMLKQMTFFSTTYISLIFLVASLASLQLYTYLSNNKLKHGTEKQSIEKLSTEKQATRFFDIGRINEPLLFRKPDYFWFCFACSVTIIVLSLGKNPGNYMTYLFQLMSPFFLVASFTLISRSSKKKWIPLPFIIFSLYHNHSILSKDFSFDQTAWNKLENTMVGKSEIYGPPLILSSLLREDKNIYLNGHTRYFSFANGKPDFFRRKDNEQSVMFVWEKYLKDIHWRIETQKFDAIILDQWMKIPSIAGNSDTAVDGSAHLKKYYERSEVIKISLADRPGGGKYYMSIWEPIKLQKTLAQEKTSSAPE